MVEQAHSHQQRALDSYECAEDGPQHGAQSDGARSSAPRRRIEVIMGDAGACRRACQGLHACKSDRHAGFNKGVARSLRRGDL